MGGAFRVWLWLIWVDSYDKLLFCLEICSKNAGLQGNTLSDHRMTTGFGPFELPTCELLQRGGTTPHIRLVLFEEPSSWLAFKVL